jgi:hypothetical protein
MDFSLLCQHYIPLLSCAAASPDCNAASQALNRRTYDPSVFEALRHEDIRHAAAALAATGHVAGLQLLLQRHRAALQPRLLALLSSLPESLDPRTYAALIPRAAAFGATTPAAAAGPGVITPVITGVLTAAAALKPAGPGNQHYAGSRKVDWVESYDMLAFLQATAAGQAALGVNPGAAAAGGQGGSNRSSADGAAAAASPPQSPLARPVRLFDDEQQQQQLVAPARAAPSPAAAAAAGGAFGSPLQSAGSLEAAAYHIHPDEAAAALHATEEMERLRLQQQLAAADPGAAAAADALQGGVRCGPSDQQVCSTICMCKVAASMKTDAQYSGIVGGCLPASTVWGDCGVGTVRSHAWMVCCVGSVI